MSLKPKINSVLDFLLIFEFRKGYILTPSLIYVNLLVFIAMTYSGISPFSPETESLVNWGANFRPLISEGQWWRILSAIFLHGGIIHLIFNMYALYYAGLILEPLLGKRRFLAIYLLSGIVSSVVSVWWQEFTVSVGSSGAIFGMYGTFIALYFTNFLKDHINKELFISISIFLVFSLLSGFQPDSGVDNAAHIGGLIAGAIMGFAMIPSLIHYESIGWKKNTIILLIILTIGGSIQTILSLKDKSDIYAYYAREMDRFESIEVMALDFYQLPEDTPTEDLLNEIERRGIYYWNQNIKLVEKLNELDLPEELKNSNELLKVYCKKRIQCYELLYKKLDSNSDDYDKEIEDCHQEIESIINELNGG